MTGLETSEKRPRDELLLNSLFFSSGSVVSYVFLCTRE